MHTIYLLYLFRKHTVLVFHKECRQRILLHLPATWVEYLKTPSLQDLSCTHAHPAPTTLYPVVPQANPHVPTSQAALPKHPPPPPHTPPSHKPACVQLLAPTRSFGSGIGRALAQIQCWCVLEKPSGAQTWGRWLPGRWHPPVSIYALEMFVWHTMCADA